MMDRDGSEIRGFGSAGVGTVAGKPELATASREVLTLALKEAEEPIFRFSVKVGILLCRGMFSTGKVQ